MKPITSGVTIPARFAQKLKTPPVRPISGLGATSEISVQPRLTMPWPKKAIDMIDDHKRVALDVIGEDDRRGQQQAGHDRQLPADIRRAGRADQVVGDIAAEQHADRRGDIGHAPRRIPT